MKSDIVNSLARGALAIAFGLLGSGVITVPAEAAPINYGDFSGTTVMYLDVTETANTPDDSEPLYGSPSITGNTLDFDPGGFTASATNGAADLTDGQLNFTLMSIAGSAISAISFSEGGDYNLLGTGTAATQIAYGVGLGSVVVLEVDGVALATPVALSGASASGGDDLSGGTDTLSLWSLGLAYDVNAALSAAGVTFTSGATKLEIAINDSLGAISETSSIAFIAKKDFMIGVDTVPFDVPEPVGALLLAAALGGLRLLGRRSASRSA